MIVRVHLTSFDYRVLPGVPLIRSSVQYPG
jgi:hypothetical protein